MRGHYGSGSDGAGHTEHPVICMRTVDTADLFALSEVLDQDDNDFAGTVLNSNEFEMLHRAYKKLGRPLQCMLCERLAEARNNSTNVPALPENYCAGCKNEP